MDNTNANLIAAKDYESDPILAEMRKRFTYAQDEWREVREEGKEDIKVVAGDPWDPKDKRQRIDAGRPALTLDEVGQYVNQLVNDVREHERAIKVTPLGDGANDQTAQFRQDLIRQIEYQSKAQDAYTAGFENAVQRSYGYWRITAKYVTNRVTPDATTGQLSPSLLDQQLMIDPIPNPDLVLPDPDFQRPDMSDIKWAFVYERWPVKDYQRRFPDAEIRDAYPELVKQYPGWFKPESIQLAEYWTIEHEKTTVWADTAEDGTITMHEGKAPKGAKSRVVETPKVKKYLTNGLEILEETDWPGSSIPLIGCFGKILYVDEGGGPKRKILSLVRLARDPYMLYCYYRTCEAELVGMTPKFPYFIRRGSLDQDELDNLQASLSQPIAVIQVNAVSDGSATPPEFPVRQPYEPPIQALEMGAESARRAIQAAMGSMALPTQAQRNNEKSGVALDKIRDSTQHGTYHFVDHYEAAITRTGVLLEELIPHFYDTPRTVAVRKVNGQVMQQRINDVPTPDATSVPVEDTDHDVTLSTGPSYQSERVAADEFASDLVENIQSLVGVIGQPAAAKILSRTIKLRNLGPIGDEMAEIISPPDTGALPPQVQGMIQQLQSENQALKTQLQTETAKIQAKGQVDASIAQIKGQIETQQTELEQDAATKRTMITAAASMSNAQVKVDAENFRSYVDSLEQGIEKQLHLAKALREHINKSALQQDKHSHEILGKALDHAHEHAILEKTAALTPPPSAVGTPPPDPTANGTGA